MRTLLRLPGLPRALLISCVVLAAVDITLVYLPALGADRGLASGFVGAPADAAGGGVDDLAVLPRPAGRAWSAAGG